MYFTSKRPIKSFQDLEVYQKLLAASVAVGRRLGTERDSSQKGGNNIGTGAVKLALDLPIKIATAHSMRFTDKPKAIAILEEVMLGCNILIVYLEQYRDIENVPMPSLPDIEGKVPAESCVIEPEFFEQQIASLTTCRWKVMHLARSWEKFTPASNALPA